MSKKFEAIKKAAFYSKENPAELAKILEGVVTDTVSSVAVTGATEIKVPTGDDTTVTYEAKALSQFGDEMSNAVTLALKAATTGVTVSGKTVTVTKTATKKTKFVLVGTCGSVKGELEVTLV